MSHNTPLENARFKLTWNKTNLHYLLGATPPDEAKIARARAWVAEAKAEVEALEQVESEGVR